MDKGRGRGIGAVGGGRGAGAIGGLVAAAAARFAGADSRGDDGSATAVPSVSSNVQADIPDEGETTYPTPVVTIVVGPVVAVAVPVVLLLPLLPVGETNVAVVVAAPEPVVVRDGRLTTGMVMVPSSLALLPPVAVSVVSGGRLTTGSDMGSSPSLLPSVAVGSTGREMTPSSSLGGVSGAVGEGRGGEATFVCCGRRHWRRPAWPWRGQRIACWQTLVVFIWPRYHNG